MIAFWASFFCSDLWTLYLFVVNLNPVPSGSPVLWISISTFKVESCFLLHKGFSFHLHPVCNSFRICTFVNVVINGMSNKMYSVVFRVVEGFCEHRSCWSSSMSCRNKWINTDYLDLKIKRIKMQVNIWLVIVTYMCNCKLYLEFSFEVIQTLVQ